MFCSNCGNTINEGDKFCTNCGQSVASNTSTSNSLSNNQYDFDVSSFGNNRIAACKYVSKAYNLSLSEAKKIVDQKYNELESITKDLKKIFLFCYKIKMIKKSQISFDFFRNIKYNIKRGINYDNSLP